MMMEHDRTADRMRSLPKLTAFLNYVDPSQQSGKPVDMRPVTIRNARSIATPLSLDREGFLLVRHRTAVVNFDDDAEVRRVYYPEIEILVKQHSGARRVVVFNHQLRRGRQPPMTAKKNLMPLHVVHNDETAKHGRERLFECLPDEATELSIRRFTAINVWRPIRGPVQESPLAVCDGRSIAPADCVMRQFHDQNGQVRWWYLFRYNPAHRWYYFPCLQQEEALLLKCYDSCEDGRTQFAAHTAFHDPTSPADAPARESLEVRTLALF
jgi:hypothetical protein